MEAIIFPESMTPERVEIAKRLAKFCQTAKLADVIRLDTIIQTTANIRASDEADSKAG